MTPDLLRGCLSKLNVVAGVVDGAVVAGVVHGAVVAVVDGIAVVLCGLSHLPIAMIYLVSPWSQTSKLQQFWSGFHILYSQTYSH